jgi:hypothetical protein
MGDVNAYSMNAEKKYEIGPSPSEGASLGLDGEHERQTV